MKKSASWYTVVDTILEKRIAGNCPWCGKDAVTFEFCAIHGGEGSRAGTRVGCLHMHCESCDRHEVFDRMTVPEWVANT